MFLKAISDSLHGNLKSCSGNHEAAVGENWTKNGGRNISKIYVAIRTSAACAPQKITTTKNIHGNM